MKPKFLALLLTLFLPFGSTLSAETSAPSPPIDIERFQHKIVELTNAERAKEKLPPLHFQSDLTAAAHWLAQAMAEHSFFAHVDHQGRDTTSRLPDFGYKEFSSCGENIGAGWDNPETAIAAWMKSPGHRANILSPVFSEIGVGVHYTETGTYHHYWVLDFGSRPDVYPVVINNEAATTTSSKVKLYIYGDGIVEKIRISNDGMQWTPWKPYQAESDWDLPTGNGKHTVYVEVNDGSKVFRSESTIEVVPERPDESKTKLTAGS